MSCAVSLVREDGEESRGQSDSLADLQRRATQVAPEEMSHVCVAFSQKGD